MKQGLSVLVHGPSKAGKSTLTFTSPLPLLVLDAEGSTKFIDSAGWGSPQKLRKISWDPTQTKPPRHDGTWDVCVVSVLDWRALDMAYQFLATGEHDFRSATLDSVTEVQRKCKTNIGVSAMQHQHWGQLLDAMDKLVRGIRDLTSREDNPLQVAVFVSETRMKDGKWRPYVQGALEVSLPYWVDICGWISQETVPDANGLPTGRMVTMLSANSPQYEAGERVQGRIPPLLAEPNITNILHAVYP